MPVFLELINQPDPADLADLEKVYADYPLGPSASLADWLFDQRDAGKTLVAGRFNGHLLGALWLQRSAAGGEIQHLCVRSITRRRGTARQMLQLLQAQAEQFQLPALIVPADVRSEALAALWRELGFDQQNGQWRWQR